MKSFRGSLVLLIIGCLAMSFVDRDYKIIIDLDKSTVSWTGKKLVGQHNGNIKIKSGHVMLTDGKLSGGEFIMDANTIETKDLKGGMKNKLDKHLKSADFFDVEKFPEASFVSTSVESRGGNGDFLVKGNLTIKGETHPVSFDAHQTDGFVTGKMMVDRTLYGIQYGSGSFFENLGDKAIDNEFTLDFKVVFIFD